MWWVGSTEFHPASHSSSWAPGLGLSGAPPPRHPATSDQTFLDHQHQIIQRVKLGWPSLKTSSETKVKSEQFAECSSYRQQID